MTTPLPLLLPLLLTPPAAPAAVGSLGRLSIEKDWLRALPPPKLAFLPETEPMLVPLSSTPGEEVRLIFPEGVEDWGEEVISSAATRSARVPGVPGVFGVPVPELAVLRGGSEGVIMIDGIEGKAAGGN